MNDLTGKFSLAEFSYKNKMEKTTIRNSIFELITMKGLKIYSIIIFNKILFKSHIIRFIF